jgi:hypothetical protein
MSIEDKIDEVDRLIGKQKDLLKDLRLFLLSPNQWMRVYKGRSEKYEQFQEHIFIRGLGAERGKILNVFSKIEFLINEIIRAKVLGLYSPQAYILDDILEYVDLSFRIKLLKKWKLIDGKMVQLISDITKVRNELAHRWNERSKLS